MLKDNTPTVSDIDGGQRVTSYGFAIFHLYKTKK